MCGLVGAAGNLLFQDEFMIKRLLFFDYLRGPDSTGLAAVRTDGSIELAKATLNPIEFFQYEPFKKVCNGGASKAFIGHNRLRTRGDVSSFNAHPFHIDHIVGAHNGTLDYQSVRNLEEALDEKFVVDSRALYTGIAKLGIQASIKMCNEGKDTKDGAWALVWYDQSKGTLNFLRNKWRELYFCYEEGFKRMFWASEGWMLREAVAASPNGYKMYNSNKKKDDEKVEPEIFLFEPDVWYEFDLNELCEGSIKRPKPKAHKLKGKEPKPVVTTTGNKHDPFGRTDKEKWFQPTVCGTPGTTATKTNSNPKTGCSPTQTSTKGASTTTCLGKTDDKKRMVIQLIGDEKHPYANIINEEFFVRNLGNECCYCSTTINYGDEGLMIFEKDNRVLCSDCAGNEGRLNPPTRIYVPGETIDVLS